MKALLGIECMEMRRECGELVQAAIELMDPVERCDAIRSIGERGRWAGPAVPDFIRILSMDQDARVRDAAAWSLCQVGTASVPYMHKITLVAHGKQPYDSRTKTQILLSAVAPLADENDQEEDKENNTTRKKGELQPALDLNSIRCSALTVLASMGKAALAVVPELIAIVQDKSIDIAVRRAARDTIVAIGPKLQKPVRAVFTPVKEQLSELARSQEKEKRNQSTTDSHHEGCAFSEDDAFNTCSKHKHDKYCGCGVEALAKSAAKAPERIASIKIGTFK